MAHQGIIEVDPKVYENDDDDYASSGYDTSTQSLTSSVQQYVYENGRRYHSYYGTEKNVMPTDETEQDRMDLHHEIFLRMLDGDLHKAPLKEPNRILDIGTGTGIWAMDMADKYPMAEVIGTDLSPIQPRWVPPNCRFEIDDAERDFTWATNSFDFIHARNIGQAISHWPRLAAEIYRCTKPGGYAEFAELCGICKSDDNSMGDNNPCTTFFEELSKAMVILGRPAYTTAAILRETLQNAGFVDITVVEAKQPLGPWPKDKAAKQTGAMVLLASETGFEAYGMACFTRVLGMQPEAARKICRDAITASRNKNYHLYTPFYVAYGRKPEA